MYRPEPGPHSTAQMPEADSLRALPALRRVRIHALPPAATLSLVALAVMASLFFLYWARPFLVPVTFGIVLALVCNPIVRRLCRYGVPRAVGATLVIAVLWGGGVLLSYAIQDNVISIVQQMPEMAEKAASRIERMRVGNFSALRDAQRAATRLERAATSVTGDAAPRSQLSVRAESSATNLRNFLLTGSAGALMFFFQLIVVSFLAFFLLSSGELMKRRLLRIIGRTISHKKSIIRMIDAMGSRIQSTLLVLCVTNIMQGLVTGFAFHALGMPNAMMWAVAVAGAHFIPYFGAGIVAIAALLAGLVQFDALGAALAPALVSLAIAAVVGNLITVWLQSFTARIDTTSIFLGMLLWGWLWGPAGLVLGAPLMAIFKAVCEHVRPLRGLAQLMEAESGEHSRQRRRKSAAHAKAPRRPTTSLPRTSAHSAQAEHASPAGTGMRSA
ncbi:AI-2E family transporter [Uliginosibacterium sp. sgz301328]|uniref:AI-2E family transporter n=1 Tax=Uliginosibacterium sp. sgz301328 TaxID=3243764 RepID=UPI00359EC5CB